MNKSPKKRGTEKVILPLDGRPNGPPADSVFNYEKADDIAMIGEIIRKSTHLAAIGIPAVYYFFGGVVLYFLAAGLLVSFTIDMVRFYGNERAKSFITKYVGIMIRPKEKREFTGATCILTSSIITIIIFDRSVAVLAIAFIVVGDTAGAIIGRIWGRVKFKNKSLEGSVSFFLACTVIALIVPGVPFWVKIAGAIVATFTEAFATRIDDNLIVPLAAGAIMQLIISQQVILEYFT